MCKDKGTKMEIYLSGCLTNCRGVNRTICIQLNTRQCILLTLLPLFFLRPPPPSGHLASLTMALAWPTFLVLYIRTKKEKEKKDSHFNQTLWSGVYSPSKHKFGIFSDCSQLCNNVNCCHSTVSKQQWSHNDSRPVH